MPECGLEMRRVFNISFLKTRLLRMIADARKKMTLWGRTAAYEGGPSVCANKTKSGQQAGNEPRDPRARSAEGGSSRGPNFGFGSGTSRFTVIQSSPASPMVDNMPMFWTVRDIDIGDGGGGGGGGGNGSSSAGKASSAAASKAEMFGHKPFARVRSRHDCHFAPGSYVLGKLYLLPLGAWSFSSPVQ